MRTCPTCHEPWQTETKRIDAQDGLREWTVQCPNHHTFEVKMALTHGGSPSGLLDTDYDIRQPQLERRQSIKDHAPEIPAVDPCGACGKPIQPGQFYAREGDDVRHLGCRL